MKTTSANLVVLILIAVVCTLVAAPATALPTPSKTQADQNLLQRQAELARIEAVIAEPEIAEAMARHGFSNDDVHQRLAQLTPEEIQARSSQIDQLQAAGSGVPTYIWILIGILLGVIIVGAL